MKIRHILVACALVIVSSVAFAQPRQQGHARG